MKKPIIASSGLFLLISVILACQTISVKGPDIGPDTCGQDRTKLGHWFISHGMPSMLAEPIPDLVHEVVSNPYHDPTNPPKDPDKIVGVCGMQWADDREPKTGLFKYRLKNFPSVAATSAGRYFVTHHGHCGACSSLQDLGVYISQNLTLLTRNCGALGMTSPENGRNCLRQLGFSDMCISIWEFNIMKSREACIYPCIADWSKPFNKPDGSLNDCLQCDEDKSGPNFKYFSGRTRRNSGIPSAIHRPPWTFYNMTHCYWYGELL